MSDEDRKVHARENDDPEESTEDVEAHVKAARANDEGDDDGGDDVEAHVKAGR